MDKKRVIAILEGEIQRREAQAKMCSFFSGDYTELANAMREGLEVYRKMEVSS